MLTEVQFDRHQVYDACAIAAAQGFDCGAFGNICGRSNRGEWKRPRYQAIAKRFYDPTVKNAGQLWVDSPYSPFGKSEWLPFHTDLTQMEPEQILAL